MDGASLPEELVARAAELDYHALALTDHDGLHGAMSFAHLAKAAGLKPITGAELTLTDGSHLTVLAANAKGYANLCRLISIAHLTHQKGEPALDPARLPEHAQGLVVLSGCRQGTISRLIAQGQTDEAVQAARQLVDWYGREQVYIELQHNLVQGDHARIRALAEVADRAGLRTVATGNVHYHVPERHRLQDVLVAIRHRTTLANSHRLRRPNADFYLKPDHVVARRFRDIPEAVTETLRIAERIEFDLTRDLGYTFPEFRQGSDQPAEIALRKLCTERLAVRYAAEPPDARAQAQSRLDEELRLIEHHGLSGFFLVYHDLMELAKDVAARVRTHSEARRAIQLPPGRGRGSSVSSLVCYLIGLSHVDPIKNNLFLGRFLNEALNSVPDIDLDFARDIREALILAVYEQYGREHAALVCSFPTYQNRMAIRDIGKALGLPAMQLDRLAKLSENHATRDLAEQMAELPEFKDKAEAPLWCDLCRLAAEISGFPRHVSQHVGGMIISARPLVEIVPIEPTRMDGRTVCQWDKDACDDARFIKIDFLSLGMLSLVEECLEHIYEQTGEIIDLSRIDFADPDVYAQIRAADTMGTFQIESRAQMQMLPRTQPQNLDDLAIQVAIVRPGPIVGGAVNPYVKRRQLQRQNKTAEIEYDHPLLKPVLAETLGVMLFQDQIMQVAQALAGFSIERADALRRAMSRKRALAQMIAFADEFRQGAAAKGVTPEVADAVFTKILAFSEFGFPKSHAYAFGVLAYQSAWLRHYHPAPYYAALLNNQPMGFYPPHVLVQDAERHGVRILPPDIQRSQAKCRVEPYEPSEAFAHPTRPGSHGHWGVRLGLAFIRDVGADVPARIVADREVHGAFADLDDLIRRVPLKQNHLENLILSGALDRIDPSRRHLLWRLGLAYRPLTLRSAIRGEGERIQPALPLAPLEFAVDVPDLSEPAKVDLDYQLLGLSTHGHLMAQLRAVLPARICSVADVGRASDGSVVETAGLVVARQRPGSAQGFVFVLIEDETGLLNIIIRPALYEERRQVVRGERLLAVKGVAQNKEGILNLVAHAIWPLAERAPTPRAAAHDVASHDFH